MDFLVDLIEFPFSPYHLLTKGIIETRIRSKRDKDTNKWEKSVTVRRFYLSLLLETMSFATTVRRPLLR